MYGDIISRIFHIPIGMCINVFYNQSYNVINLKFYLFFACYATYEKKMTYDGYIEIKK